MQLKKMTEDNSTLESILLVPKQVQRECTILLILSPYVLDIVFL